MTPAGRLTDGCGGGGGCGGGNGGGGGGGVDDSPARQAAVANVAGSFCLTLANRHRHGHHLQVDGHCMYTSGGGGVEGKGTRVGGGGGGSGGGEAGGKAGGAVSNNGVGADGDASVLFGDILPTFILANAHSGFGDIDRGLPLLFSLHVREALRC